MLPLGNGFDLDVSGKNWWLVGGGVGFSTLFPVAFALKGVKADFHIFLGARNIDQLPPPEWISGWDVPEKVTLCTDDGTLGYRGTVDAAVRERIGSLTQPEKERVTILSCGPPGMLKSLADIALSAGIPAFVSLENHMACGFGVCWGCATEIRSGEGKEYLRVCREGPVFNAGDVVW
jgi:dihydroorotate dehydrogenase electron transfer subunit